LALSAALTACSSPADVSMTVNCAHGSSDRTATRQIGEHDHTADFYDQASGEDITEDVQYINSGGTFMQLGTLGTVHDGETVATGTYIKVVAGAGGKPGFTLSCIKDAPAASPTATHS